MIGVPSPHLQTMLDEDELKMILGFNIDCKPTGDFGPSVASLFCLKVPKGLNLGEVVFLSWQ